MKAIVLEKTGKPEVLRLTELPEPVPDKGEVLVRLHYSGINYAEILSRKGLYGWAVKRPYTLGMEGSGIIEAVGEGVDSGRIGERVAVGTQYGCYAEKIAVPSARALPAPEQFSMEECAAYVVVYMTAWVSLFELARLSAGEKVLITAAAGGVGTAAVQLASKAGAEVYGLAGSTEKIDRIIELGATGGFNYRQADCFRQLADTMTSADVILEMVGGKVYRESFALLSPFGRLVVAGFASLNLNKLNPLSWIKTLRDIPRVSIMQLAHKTGAVMASHLGYLLDNPEKMMAIYDRLTTFVAQHQIHPVVGATFPFEQAAEAHAFIESRKSVGKVLLRHNI